MHRRRAPPPGPSEAEAATARTTARAGSSASHNGGIHHLPSPAPRRRRGRRGPTTTAPSDDGSGLWTRLRGGGRLKGRRLACFQVVAFCVLFGSEVAVYRMLGGEIVPSPAAHSVASAARRGLDRIADRSVDRDADAAAAAAVEVAGDANGIHDNNDGNIGSDHRKHSMKEAKSPKKDDRTTPRKLPPPAPSPAELPRATTYEPTKTTHRWRMNEARRDVKFNSDFWKSHAPDPVPPLPPDRDPTTGEELPPVIAYVVTLTKCGPKHRGSLDGAATLLHSIRRNSHGWIPTDERTDAEEKTRPYYGGKGGRYRHRAYVIVDPVASPTIRRPAGYCARFLRKIGYHVLHRAPLLPLFNVTDDDLGAEPTNQFYDEWKSQGYVGMRRPPSSLRPGERPDKLRWMLHNDGCCGYAELLKLHAYGLVEHDLVVHLDLDSLVLRPMDDLFDAMLLRSDDGDDRDPPAVAAAKLPRTKEVDFGRTIDAAFTRDYNSVIRPRPDAPVGYQGGFLVVRPSSEVLERYRDALRDADFRLGTELTARAKRLGKRNGRGWAGIHGGFYGDVTFQGIVPYYYESIAPRGEHNELELDRCVYNQMADNPRKSTYKYPRATPLDAAKMGFRDTATCRDGREDCSDADCQRVHPKDTITTHFTFCKKPWDCSAGLEGTVAAETCRGLLREWYAVRRELEDWWSTEPGKDAGEGSDDDDQRGFYWKEETRSKVRESRTGTLVEDRYLGYCDDFKTEGYRRLVEPDGPRK